MKHFAYIAMLLLALSFSLLGCGAGSSGSAEILEERVTFTNEGLTLEGYVYRPSGSGPYPAIVWNHGSEADPYSNEQFLAMAEYFVPAGYVFFAPIRRGQSGSEGAYIQDTLEQIRSTMSPEEGKNYFVHLMETEQLNDQLAGLNWLRAQNYVDGNRVAVMGCSYGGIQSLLGAASDASNYKTAVPISPAAMSWEGNLPLQQSLINAVSGIDIPTFLIHPPKDDSLLPGQTLAQEFQNQDKPYELKIYPATGPEQEQVHCFGGPQGNHVWAPDAIKYLQDNMH
jgi:Dipeptidyl aminopeptidases/acylaminoacyl-peptidases